MPTLKPSQVERDFDDAMRVGGKPWAYVLIPHDEVEESKRVGDYLRFQIRDSGI